MEKYRKIIKNTIFNDVEKHHIFGVAQFIENLTQLNNEGFFNNIGVDKLEIELNRINASYKLDGRDGVSIISNLKGYDSDNERIENITTELMNKIGFVSSPLQKISVNYLPGDNKYRYSNISVYLNNDIAEQLRVKLITEDLQKKIDIALLQLQLDENLNNKHNESTILKRKI